MIQIRDYIDDDYDQLLSLYKDSSAYGGKYDPERDTPDRLSKTASQGDLLVATHKDALVGSIMILDNPHSIWLMRFVIDVGHEHAKTAGTRLVEHSDRIARSRGHKDMIVYTDPEDEVLNARYQDLNFNKSGLYRCYWKGTS